MTSPTLQYIVGADTLPFLQIDFSRKKSRRVPHQLLKACFSPRSKHSVKEMVVHISRWCKDWMLTLSLKNNSKSRD